MTEPEQNKQKDGLGNLLQLALGITKDSALLSEYMDKIKKYIKAQILPYYVASMTLQIITIVLLVFVLIYLKR